MFRSRSKTLVVLEDREGQTVGYSTVGRSWLIVCSLRALQRLPFGEELIRRWGYRCWACDTVSPMAYYARPWPVWALLWALEKVRLGNWRLLWWLYDRGVFHLTEEEYGDFRWRSVRLGRGR